MLFRVGGTERVMAEPNRRSIGVDRRASTRISRISMDPEDSDYDLETAGISDGFNPMNAGRTLDNRLPSQTSQPSMTGRRTPPPRPSSTTKPKGLDSFALRHDGAMGPGFQRNSTVASSSNAPLTRASSVSTESAYVVMDGPYQGPSGPSHPYQSYPQESRLARTMSIATTSTVQIPDRPYTGPGGPQHPYGMYPQNTVPEVEVANDPAPDVAGFPGLNNQYQRRLGPEGEEIADIIGPDGHTEQLPPYTQYADEAFARKAGITLPPVQTPSVAPVAPLAGAGGIGLATRNPEFASREDLNSPQSRQSIRSMTSDSTGPQINMGALSVVNEKPELKKWQQNLRKKVCGVIPVWAIVLSVVVFILFGIVLGTVLALLGRRHANYPKHRPPPGSNTITTTMTTTFDASPITATPSNLPALPTGTFALPIALPNTVQNSCITNTQLSAAWGCNMAPSADYTIKVTSFNNGVTQNDINLGMGNGTFGGFYPYGTQPPVLAIPQQLNLVTDNQDPSRGPAWFFELPYDKLVILPDMMLSPPNSKRELKESLEARGGHHSSDDFMRKGVAQVGDKPWFCYWNSTLLEGFVYVSICSKHGRLLLTITGKFVFQLCYPSFSIVRCCHTNLKLHSYAKCQPFKRLWKRSCS